MTQSLPWFRLYTSTVDNYKLRTLAYEDRWHYVAILCCKGEGLLDGKRPEFVRRTVSIKLGLAQIELDEVIRRLSEAMLIDAQTMQPTGWSDRQFDSDNSTKRVRKHRNNKGSGNVTETLQKRKCNAPDTDTDTDKESKPKKPVFDALRHLIILGVSEQTAADWITLRKQKKAAVTKTAIDGISEESKKAGISVQESLEICCASGWQGFKAEWVKCKTSSNEFAGML